MKITIETGEWSRRSTIIGILCIAAIGAVAIAVILLLADGGSSEGKTVTLTAPSGSMEPTLKTGEKFKVNVDAYTDATPAVGDIVVFRPPIGAESSSECGVLVRGLQPLEVGEACPKPTPGTANQTFVKRVVAVGGDTLAIKDGHPVVNGVEKSKEPYTRPCGGGYECNLPKQITIPAGYYFVLGDNRGESDDSRYWGPVPASSILGRVED